MGSNDDAQKEAQRSEEQRRANVEATQRRIEGIYSDPRRELDIRDVENATRDYLQGDLNRQHGDNTRQLKFALARDGQTMGSVDVDQNRSLAEKFLRGAVEVQRRADGAGNTLRQADQSSKLNLFSAASQGLDMTTAARQAGEAMRNNIGIAKTDALQTGMGDMFGDLGAIYKRSRERAGTADQQRQLNNFYTPNQWYGGMGTGSGTGPG